MKDVHALARVQEAERIIHEAIADVPLTCSGPEAAAAVQGLGLKLAEACMSPQAIAHNLINQAEAYLVAAGHASAPPLAPEPLDEATITSTAHRILTEAADKLKAAGIPPVDGSALMLGYAAAWTGKTDPAGAAEALYRYGDALIGKHAAKH
ncbi:hypothetical protein [uncultured Brevundimonas sp.]|uniref:hypothetical protein n=1 Tax=uncultured Brevundimonas sp. TaxID=213418 RepID=UPI0025D9DDB3|nr:hypothetical protein [uncultured Brevundimonas sp.]